MGWQGNVFQVLIVVSGPNFTGFFVYNGTPAKGNLVAQIVAPGTTSDPFGNAVNAALNIGSWSAAGAFLQHFGVDQNGLVYIVGPDNVVRIKINNGFGGVGPDIRFFNDFGAVILVVDPSRGGTFQYQDNNSAVQGVLIGAQVGKNTTDPVNGTAVNAGVTLIDPVFGDSSTVVGAIINLIQAAFTQNAIVTANTGSGVTSPFLSLAGPEQGHAGHAVLRIYGVSADGTVPGGVIVSATDPPVRAAAALLEVQGSQAFTGIAAPAAPPAADALLFADTSGFMEVLAGGDGNRYDTERLTLFLAVGSNFTINSTTPQTIFSKHLGVGTYEIEVWGVTSNTTPADAAQFAFAFTGTASGLVDYETISGTGPAVVNYTASATFTQGFNTQGVAGNQQLLAHLTVTVTVAGTLTFTGKELVAANTVTVFGGSRMRICPIVAS